LRIEIAAHASSWILIFRQNSRSLTKLKKKND
jgi:hypothetical protein